MQALRAGWLRILIGSEHSLSAARAGESLGFPAIFFGIDHAMYIFDYIALGAALASAVSLFAAFVFGALPLP
jgi:hypothetical protein